MRTGDTADLIDHTVDHLLADSVVTTGICSSSKSCVHHMLRLHTVVGSIFLAADQQLGVEQLAVGTSADLINGLSRLASSFVHA